MTDLFAKKLTLDLPAQYGIFGRVAGNLIKQVVTPPQTLVALVGERTLKTTRFFTVEAEDDRKFAAAPRSIAPPKDFPAVLRIGLPATLDELPEAVRLPSTRWSRPRPRNPADLSIADAVSLERAIRASWQNAFDIKEEHYEGSTLVSPGLRPPQVGAIHAVKAHWVVSSEPATVVMPTGTGKTETMLALLVSEPIARLLVVVPTDPLREQIATKFATLGELKRVTCLAQDALYPLVTVLKRAPKTADEIDQLVGRTQVIVATMQALTKMAPELQAKLADAISHLFIDEAHHIGAKTWKKLKRRFVEKKKPILQFTATPYRNDERRIDGKFIFTYPLRRAQEQDLFRPVHYEPVLESRQDRADLAIIAKVGAALDRDLGSGLDHLAMARTDGIERAQHLLTLYGKHLPKYPAALIHSKMKASERAGRLEDLRHGRIRIIVCVDMLGEGFDLPKLKIAGLHDPHKSEAITFQFIGRFTRRQKGLGDATVIARVSLNDPHEILNALYREDADWNHLLRFGSALSIEREKRREDLYSGLDEVFEGIPFDAVAPRLSAFVFRTNCLRWQPHAVIGLEKRSATIVEEPIVNEEFAFAMMVMRHEDRLRWARVNQPTDVIYNLVMAHWDEERALLYIHSSSVEGLAYEAAKLIAGDDVIPLRGEAVFRVLHGYRRVMLNNLGVRETQVKPVRFQLSTGINITEELEATASNRTRIKTNLYGTGYVDEPVLDGEEQDTVQPVKRGIGCSIKGKIWSQEAVAYPGQWIEWCHTIGPKIADESITTEMVLRNIMRPRRQASRPPNKIPLSIDWPESFTRFDENRADIIIDGKAVPLAECDIEISRHSETGPIRFRVKADPHSAEYTLDIRDSAAVFNCVSAKPALLRRGKRERDIAEAFQEDPPAIRFTDGDMLVGADLAVAPPDSQGYFDTSLIEVLDWTGVDITKESQGAQRKAGTVQRFVLDRLIKADPSYDLIFDGDASGEVADVIAIRRQGRVLDVELYHCKFSAAPTPGSRVEDLYEVCGQAMKSIRWADPRSPFLARMRRQEENRLHAGGMSRFEKGDQFVLDEWIGDRRQLTTRFSVFIVQPGYSAAKIDPKHTPMFESVRSYLMQTYAIKFGFWANK